MPLEGVLPVSLLHQFTELDIEDTRMIKKESDFKIPFTYLHNVIQLLILTGLASKETKVMRWGKVKYQTR